MNSFGVLATVLAQATDTAVQVADAAEAAEATPPGSMFGWAMLLGLAAIVFVPFLLGQVIERALRLRDVAFRIGLLLFLLMIVICGDVLLRNVPLIPSMRGFPATNDLSEAFLYLITLLSAPWLTARPIVAS